MRIDRETQDRLIEQAGDVTGPEKIAAACLYGSRVYGYAGKNSDYDVLVICDRYDEGARYHRRKIGNVQVTLLVVDKALFEMDVKRGAFGEFLAGRILTPYVSLLNAEHLKKSELSLKLRVTQEEIEDLILSHGELVRGLVIQPEYFVLARLRKTARVFVPFRTVYSRMLRHELFENNLRLMTLTVREILPELEKHGILVEDSGHLTVSKNHIDSVMARKDVEHVVNLAELSQRAVNSYLMQGRTAYLNVDMLVKELIAAFFREFALDGEDGVSVQAEDFLLLKTASGLVRFNERASIRDMAKKILDHDNVTVSPLAGVLNDVYLVKSPHQKLVAKRYTEWHSFKWFMLNVVSIGTKSFSVSAKSRLSNEFGLNRYLSDNEIKVPTVHHVSVPDRLLFREFVEGMLTSSYVKSILTSEDLNQDQRSAAKSLGLMLARIHSLEVSLGDSKPENVVLTREGGPVVLDLEQASKGGDLAWDIAEFLFYSGHYALTGIVKQGLKDFCFEFIAGYAEAGSRETLRKAAALKYTKLFSVWTPTPLVFEITRHLKRA